MIDDRMNAFKYFNVNRYKIEMISDYVDKYCKLNDEMARHISNSVYGIVSSGNSLRLPSIKNVIFNDPATIVFWDDGTKTVVKCQENDIYDKEKGLAMAISKKALGTNKSQSNFNNIFKKWLQEDENLLNPLSTRELISSFAEACMNILRPR